MTKRRLSQQQLRRIQSQQKSLRQSGETESDGLRGRVVVHYGRQLKVEALEGPHQGRLFRCVQRSNLPPLVTGDEVIWQPDGDDRGVVLAREPRRTEMNRPGPRGEMRAIAVNVDTVVVVMAPLPEPFGNLIDRYLVAIEHLGLQAVLLVNKADLLTQVENPNRVVELLQRYTALGYPTLEVSCVDGQGFAELRDLLKGHTAVFVGQSGVGKSSLINLLRGVDDDDDEAAAVGDLSVGHDKGTHTTTATRLYHLPGSGDLIDSPGIREFGLWHIERTDLDQGFVEIRRFAERCRFRDCLHREEPGCAVVAAGEENLIDPARLESYYQILQSLESGPL